MATSRERPHLLNVSKSPTENRREKEKKRECNVVGEYPLILNKCSNMFYKVDIDSEVIFP